MGSRPDGVKEVGLPGRALDPVVEFTRAEVEQSIPARFEQQAQRFPQRVAVQADHEQLTYLALKQRVDRIANAVRAARGDSPEPIALLLENSSWTPAAMLGTLKAGKFYVPLDPRSAPARLAFMLEESEAQLILVSPQTRQRAKSLRTSSQQLLVVTELPQRVEDCEPQPVLTPDSLAYIMYTSGSTGVPKGVLNNQRNVLREVRVFTNSLGLTPNDRVALTRPIHLYGTLKMVMGSLMNGASLHITNYADLGALGLANWLHDHEITVFAGPVTVMRAFASELPADIRLPSVRWVLVGAEALYGADLDLLQTRFGDNVRFHHSFGASESGSAHQISFGRESDRIDGVVPAGYRHDDVEAVILDEQGQRLEAGQVGQIGVVSDFLALGYWRKPALTAERFTHDPETGKRLYLTGDLGMLREDGCLVHLGRQDQQVKIGGNRVEIAEVEAALLAHPAVTECCVVLDKSNPHRDQLLAHCVIDADLPPTPTELYDFLAQRIPSHMMPARFNWLDALPKTAAGKTDRAAIARFEATTHEPDSAPPSAMPTDALQLLLCAIWCDILHLPQVEIHASFLELGGDSISAMMIANRLQRLFAQPLSVKVILDAYTVAQLAGNLRRHYPEAVQRLEVELSNVVSALEADAIG